MEDNQEFIQDEYLNESTEHQDNVGLQELNSLTDNISYDESNNDLELELASEREFLDENVVPEGEVASKKRNKIIDVIWYVFFGIVLLITILTCCSVFMFDCYVVSGISMQNTVFTGDKVTVCVWEKPQQGDMVIINDKTSGSLLIKRVIAYGPALVRIDESGNVFVDNLNDENDNPNVCINEPYVSKENKVRKSENGTIIEDLTLTGLFIEEGKVFYMGDNRKHSTDSREKGAVPKDWIVGKVSEKFLKIKDTKFYKFLTTNFIGKEKEKIHN